MGHDRWLGAPCREEEDGSPGEEDLGEDQARLGRDGGRGQHAEHGPDDERELLDHLLEGKSRVHALGVIAHDVRPSRARHGADLGEEGGHGIRDEEGPQGSTDR